MNSEILNAQTQRLSAELSRSKILLKDIQLSHPKPADFYIQKVKRSVKESEKSRRDLSNSPLKSSRKTLGASSITQRSISALRHSRPKSRESNAYEGCLKLTTDESLQKSFPEWLLNKTEFLNHVKQPSTTVQARVAEACAKYSKKRTVKEKQEILDYVSKLEFFKTIPFSLLTRAIEKMTTVVYSPGQKLMQQGDEGDCLLILVIGRVSVYINGVKLVELTENNIVGELALVTRAKRSATVVAETDVKVLKLESKAYEDAISILKRDEVFELTRLMSTYRCFSMWNRDMIHMLSTYAAKKTYIKGQVIYEQGQESNALYIVISGKVKLQAYVKVEMGNKWPVGRKMWENVKLEKTVTIDIREIDPGETFGGHEIVENCLRITRALVKTDSTIVSINKAELAEHFLKNDIQDLLNLSKFMIPTEQELHEKARLKLRKVRDHSKHVEDSIAADFNYSERTTVEDLRSRLMRRWIGSFNIKLKKATMKLNKDIVSISKSVKYLTRRLSET
eukprot:CAMPEP_0204901046 /NCGR_PEP_ID=MMETSP1397-20131031/2841_1 /ASSEMBLY_ACC=CAM_ASM_000891 /TAXON_ID=49980 /ORGANISM="Climacostomum Climacostomum virens, Strain Stock W-24" /LENGTH=507 /DNA_ID=CAMNT_0052069321 /DNA_START=180 /DNA_END=1700 /DNA_ORIENTATION=+